jgi:CS domain
VIAAMHQADALQQQQNIQASDNEEVLYVMIPTDTSKPLQQLSFRPDKNAAGDALVEHLQSSFSIRDDESIDIDLLRQQQQSQQTTLLASTSTDLPTVSDTTLRKVSEQASVETFTLVHPSPSNQYTSIVLYLDEIGMMKRLPLNTRASDYCTRAGYNPAPIFYGTIYMGRIQQKPRVRNISFRLGPDTSYDAAWLQSAMATNLQYQLEMNKHTGSSGNTRQAGVAGSDGNVQNEDGYSWTQTEQEIEIVVPLPIDAISKQVTVKFQPLHLTVLHNKEAKVSIPLFERVDVDACTWTLDSSISSSTNGNPVVASEDHKRLIITMEKLEEAYWPRLRD